MFSFASLSQLMVLRKMSLNRSPPLNNNCDEQASTALTLLSLQDRQITVSPISMITSEVLLQYLFENRIDNECSTHAQENIRNITQVITSYLSPRSEARSEGRSRTPLLLRQRPSIVGCATTNVISIATCGPAKKRLKTRYYLENKSISTPA